jgi:transposase-like protein
VQGKKAPTPEIDAVRKALRDEVAACAFMEDRRWGNCPNCPGCGSIGVYRMTGRDGKRERHMRWRCRDCGKLFSVRTGTVMEDSRLPLRHWVHAFWRACASKKGVAALQIQRELGINYKSALFMLNRIRLAMKDWTGDGTDKPLGCGGGTVEADETYVGGKPRPGSGEIRKRGRGTSKTPVFAMVERGGNVRMKVMERITSKTLGSVIRESVDGTARLVTDDLSVYYPIGRAHPGGHESVKHGQGEYVRKGTDIHSNTAESVFALLKRGVYGVFHSISKKHLPRYLSEFEFRWNTRWLNDGQRTSLAVKNSEGKRMVYREKSGT